MKNKKSELAKWISLFLATALLAGVLLVTASAAEFDLPEMPDWDSQAWDSSDRISNDFGSVQRSADAALNDSPIFHLWLTDGSQTAIYTAFYARDPATGNTYLLSFANVGKIIEKYGLSYSLKSLKGSGSVEYLGNDNVFAYFRSDALSGYTPMELGSTASDSVLIYLLEIDNSGNPAEIGTIDVDLSTWKQESDVVFKYTSEENDLTVYNGVPVLSAEDGTVIGMTYTTGHLCIVRFGGTNFAFAQKYAMSASAQDAPEEGNDGSGSSAEPTKAEERKKEEDSTDNTKLYLIIGAAAVAAFLFYRKNEKEKQKAQKSNEGSISLGPDNLDGGNGGTTASSAMINSQQGQGQDIYGPTVPRPTKGATGPTEPVQEGGTVPLAQWQLRAVEGPLSGKVYPLGSSLTIGRSSRCDVKFSQDAPGISGTHCQVTVKGDKVSIQDLGSSYGTFYPQNNRLDPKTDYPLHEGGVFSLAQGGGAFRLEKAGAAAAADTGGIVIKDLNGKTYRSDASMRITLGRGSGCQGGFGSGESSVSGRHCELYREGGKLYLRDLNSTNGTFFSQDERLRPNEPYRIRRGMAFFLTTPKYTFVVVEE